MILTLIIWHPVWPLATANETRSLWKETSPKFAPRVKAIIISSKTVKRSGVFMSKTWTINPAVICDMVEVEPETVALRSTHVRIFQEELWNFLRRFWKFLSKGLSSNDTYRLDVHICNRSVKGQLFVHVTCHFWHQNVILTPIFLRNAPPSPRYSKWSIEGHKAKLVPYLRLYNHSKNIPQVRDRVNFENSVIFVTSLVDSKKVRILVRKLYRLLRWREDVVNKA